MPVSNATLAGTHERTHAFVQTVGAPRPDFHRKANTMTKPGTRVYFTRHGVPYVGEIGPSGRVINKRPLSVDIYHALKGRKADS